MVLKAAMLAGNPGASVFLNLGVGLLQVFHKALQYVEFSSFSSRVGVEVFFVFGTSTAAVSSGTTFLDV